MNSARAGNRLHQWLQIAVISGFILLLPFHRSAEISTGLLMFTGIALLLRHRHRITSQPWFKYLLIFFLAMWLPMLISGFDSLRPDKTWSQTITAARFPFSAIAIIWFCRNPDTRLWVFRICSWILLAWAADALFQFIAGFNLLGYPNVTDRLNGVFGIDNLMLGVTLAVLAPIPLEYARRHWPSWGLLLAFLLISVVLFLSGMRTAWLIWGSLLLGYIVLVLRHRHETAFKQALLLPLAGVILFAGSYLASPVVKTRINDTLHIKEFSEQGLDHALTMRLPIWGATLEMIKQNPLNGVGVRAFPIAYLSYAPEDDIHITREGGIGASHAHNLVLEVLSDTGAIGLAGLVVALLLSAHIWRRTNAGQHRAMLPYAFCLILLYLPTNSYFSYFGSHVSSITWWLLAMALAAMAGPGEHE